MRGDKERPFSGVTKSGRVWRKVPESDAGSVTDTLIQDRNVDPHLLTLCGLPTVDTMTPDRNVDSHLLIPNRTVHSQQLMH